VKAALALFLTLTFWPAIGQAVDCSAMIHESNRYTICEVDVTTEELRLFLRDDKGEILGHFSDVKRAIGAEKSLPFAMNAGMYHPDRSPVGLYIENGTQEQRLYTNASPGNFGLLPNGVLCLNAQKANVIEAMAFKAANPKCQYATQSGPMLVIDGALHPKFIPDSTSRNIRNGVGTTADGKTAYFVKSENSVTFHEFGTLFKDVIKVPNALFLDGKISRLHSAQLNRSDPGFWMGPIVGVVE
jgi:uncharacterized protein YigE (DUF2233 family)